MGKEYTYAQSGVNRERRTESKKALALLKALHGLSRYGRILQLPYGIIFPIDQRRYFDLQIEGVGTKVLIAQLADKYSTIGIDGVAMAVNDVIRSGAKPIALADNIHAETSDPSLVKDWMEGIAIGARSAECLVSGGEIGDVPDLVRGLVEEKGFDMIVAAVGEVPKERIITGQGINLGDAIIGMRSSGLHSNGVSLARRILFKQWGGKYEAFDVPEGLDRELVYEALEPTKIYVKSIHEVANSLPIKGAVHITGDAYLKFQNLGRFSHNIGFEFNEFSPQPIFQLIQKTALDLGGKITDEEMFKTFNMGWGFAIIVDKIDSDNAVDILKKNGVEAKRIGVITKSPSITILYKNRQILLQ